MGGTDSMVPDEVVVSNDRQELRLDWEGGRSLSLRSAFLRGSCRCAWCTRDRVLNRFPASFNQVALVDVDALGSHGLHLKFSDGHERGIYPWPYLRDLGACAHFDAGLRMPASASSVQIGSNP